MLVDSRENECPHSLYLCGLAALAVNSLTYLLVSYVTFTSSMSHTLCIIKAVVSAVVYIAIVGWPPEGLEAMSRIQPGFNSGLAISSFTSIFFDNPLRVRCTRVSLVDVNAASIDVLFAVC